MHLRGHARDRAREGRRIGADDDARRVLRRPCERRAAAAMGGDQTAEMFASGRERRRWCARAPSSSSARRTRARPCRPRRGAAIAANASRDFTAWRQWCGDLVLGQVRRAQGRSRRRRRLLLLLALPAIPCFSVHDTVPDARVEGLLEHRDGRARRRKIRRDAAVGLQPRSLAANVVQGRRLWTRLDALIISTSPRQP